MPARALSSLLFPAFFALSLSACATAPVAAPVHTPGPDDEKLLRAQSDAWDKAIVRKDKPAIESNMAPRFFHIGSDGSTQDAASFVADLVDPQLVIDPYVVPDLEVKFYGHDTALLTATTRMTGSYKGEKFESYYRYIDHYVFDDGKWRIVSVQTTKIKK